MEQLNPMEKTKSVFASLYEKNCPITVAEVAKAISRIEDFILQKITKTIFRDLLTGLKVLTSSMQQSEEVLAYSIIIKWLQLHLQVANALNPNDDKLREQFEKYIPPTILYIVAALYYKPNSVEKYHFHLLQLSLQLLNTVNEATLQKVANAKPELIACLWRPINYVGDFNTQLSVLHLIVKLVKCVDDNRQKQILEEICCSASNHALKDSINNAIHVANFHAGKFENLSRVRNNDEFRNDFIPYQFWFGDTPTATALCHRQCLFALERIKSKLACRELLNNFNINLAHNVLVYSLRCKRVKYGSITTFYKPLNSEYLWIDLNYCPRTLTFSTRYKATNKDKLVNLDICVEIDKLTLNKRTLLVFSNKLPNFSPNIINGNVDITTAHNFELELLNEEALRLEENHCVLEYYNSAKNQTNSMIFGDKDKLQQHTVNNKQTSVTIRASCATENFQNSYPLLIGNAYREEGSNIRPNNSLISDPISTNCDNLTFKLPSLSHFENALVRAKLSQENNPNSQQKNNSTIQTPINKAKSRTANDTPKSSLSGNISRDESHPISELTRPNGTGKRRFFLTKASANNGQNKDGGKKVKSTKTTAKRYRNKIERTLSSPPKRKQVNKVKPMSHLAKNDGDPEEAVQEYVENGGIINITNFLSSGNESAAVFNEDERRIILQNVNRINENLERSARRFFRADEKAAEADKSSNFDICNDSYAEPGQSYQNFKVLRPKVENLALQKPKVRPARKPKKRAEIKIRKVDSKKNNQSPKMSKVADAGRRTRKRRVNISISKVTAETANNIETEPKRKISNLCAVEDNSFDLTTCIKNSQNNNNNNNKENQTSMDNSKLEPPPAKQLKLYSKKLMRPTKYHTPGSFLLSSSSEDDNDDIIPNKVPNILAIKGNLDDIPEIRHDVSIQQIISDNDAAELILRNTVSISSPRMSTESIDDSQKELAATLPTTKTQISSLRNDGNKDFSPILAMSQHNSDYGDIEISSQTISNIITVLEGKESSGNISNEPLAVLNKKTDTIIHRGGNISPVERITTLDEEILLAPGKQTAVENHSSNLNYTLSLSGKLMSSQNILNDPLVPKNQLNLTQNITSEANYRKKDPFYNSDCLVHHHRSDDDESDDELEKASSSCKNSQLLENMPTTPHGIAIERIAAHSMTRTGRRSISISAGKPTMQTCQVTRTSITTTHQLISKDVFYESSQCPTELVSFQSIESPRNATTITSNNQLIQHDSSLSKSSGFQYKTISNYMLSFLERNEEQDDIHNPIQEDVSEILHKYEQNMNLEFEKLKSARENSKLESVINKVVEMSRNLIVEAERERAELENTKIELKKLMEQFLCLWKTYRTRTERFNGFKEKVEDFFNTLSEMDLEEDVHKENEKSLNTLRNAANEIRSTLWQELLKDTTENFVKNISNLSML